MAVKAAVLGEHPNFRLSNQAVDKYTYDSGAQRDDQDGKGRYDLLPPEALRQAALRYEAGADHYGDRNWEKGIPLSRYFSPLIRHLNQWAEGHADEAHLGAAIFNLMCLIATEERALNDELPEELIDMGPNTP